MKTCTKCGGPGPFGKHSNACGLRPDCKICVSARAKAWRALNANRLKAKKRAEYLEDRGPRLAKMKLNYHANRTEIRARMKVVRANNLERFMLNHCRASAKARGLAFDLTIEDILIPKMCPLLGIEIRCGEGRVMPHSPTIDRIDSSKGYVRGNVWVVSARANTVKSDATLQELEMLVSALRERLKLRLA